MATDSCPKLAELEGVYIAIATGDTAMADGDAVRAALAHAAALDLAHILRRRCYTAIIALITGYSGICGPR